MSSIHFGCQPYNLYSSSIPVLYNLDLWFGLNKNKNTLAAALYYISFYYAIYYRRAFHFITNLLIHLIVIGCFWKCSFLYFVLLFFSILPKTFYSMRYWSRFLKQVTKSNATINHHIHHYWVSTMLLHFICYSGVNTNSEVIWKTSSICFSHKQNFRTILRHVNPTLRMGVYLDIPDIERANLRDYPHFQHF